MSSRVRQGLGWTVQRYLDVYLPLLYDMLYIKEIEKIPLLVLSWHITIPIGLGTSSRVLDT